MAFKKAIILQGDVEVPNAYHKIVHFDADATSKKLKIEIAIYKDSATRQANEDNCLKGYSKTLTITNDPDNDFNDFFTTDRPAGSLINNIYTSLYVWIKSKNNFYSDAEDR